MCLTDLLVIQSDGFFCQTSLAIKLANSNQIINISCYNTQVIYI